MIKDIYLIKMGNRIKKIRKERGLSVRKLSAMCGIDFSNYSRIENGQKDAHILTLKKIADILESDLKDFLL